MKSFKDFVNEVNTAGAGGVFGTGGQNLGSGGLVGNFDLYAPGDARLPSVLSVSRRPDMVAKKKKKSKLKDAIKGKS
jgi:hypothetical protein